MDSVKFRKLEKQYGEKFNERPPLLGYPAEMALKYMERALETGEPMRDIGEELDYYDLINLYQARFGEGPPTFGYSEGGAIEGIKKAIRTGRRMPGAEKEIEKRLGLKPGTVIL